jgi:hypothetical protein
MKVATIGSRSGEEMLERRSFLGALAGAPSELKEIRK